MSIASPSHVVRGTVRRDLIERNLKYVLEATLPGARGPHARLIHGLDNTKNSTTSPDGPTPEFHDFMAAAPGQHD
jgi:hypothetical protein